MVRRRLAVPVVMILAGALLLAGAACGEGKPLPEASFSPVARPFLADVSEVALLKGRPAHVMLHVDSSQGLRIFILAEHPLRSHSLRKVAAQDGTLVQGEDIALQGSPHSSKRTTVYRLLTPQPLTPGWYRLDLLGEGRVESLLVDRQ